MKILEKNDNALDSLNENLAIGEYPATLVVLPELQMENGDARVNETVEGESEFEDTPKFGFEFEAEVEFEVEVVIKVE